MKPIEQLPPESITESALECVLLFHGGGEWDLDKRIAWSNRAGGNDATTRGLCNIVRRALGTLQGEIKQLPGEDATEYFERIAKLFYEETGYVRPGKDVPAAKATEEYQIARGHTWAWWIKKKHDEADAAERIRKTIA